VPEAAPAVAVVMLCMPSARRHSNGMLAD
jgi:hypothetical protein